MIFITQEELFKIRHFLVKGILVSQGSGAVVIESEDKLYCIENYDKPDLKVGDECVLESRSDYGF